MKAFCIKLFQQELRHFDAHKKVFVGNEDSIAAARAVLIAKLRLLEGEDRDAFVLVYGAYRSNPQATIQMMLNAATKRKRVPERLREEAV